MSEKYKFKGYRIDGVAACRLAWQWFCAPEPRELAARPNIKMFIDRQVNEPLSVRLAGEYDIWCKDDPRAELFQHGLRSQELTPADWALLLEDRGSDNAFVRHLLDQGKPVQYAKTHENESIIKAKGFTIRWSGLTFLALNTPRCNSLSFTAGITPAHDALMGFNWNGKHWRVSLYGVPSKPDVDLAKIAVANGGGGHQQACGFTCEHLPFDL